jgi:hypothetical protein
MHSTLKGKLHVVYPNNVIIMALRCTAIQHCKTIQQYSTAIQHILKQIEMALLSGTRLQFKEGRLCPLLFAILRKPKKLTSGLSLPASSCKIILSD